MSGNIASQLRFNSIPAAVDLHNLFLPRPIRGYRKERGIGSGTSTRVSVSDVFQPNGLIPAPVSGNCNGVFVPRKSLLPQSVFCSGTMDSTDGANELRRLRGGTRAVQSSREHMRSRNRLFEQNTSNLTNCPTGCPPITLNSSNNTFSYTWVDGEEYTVTFVPGDFYTSGLEEVLVAAQLSHGHFFTRGATGARVVAIHISQVGKVVSLTSALVSDATYPSSEFLLPVGADWVMPSEGIVPQIHLPAGFAAVIGFAAGTYPFSPIVPDDGLFFQPVAGSPAFALTQVFSSSVSPLLSAEYQAPPPYSYRNPQYSSDNAVSSSERLYLAKYNSIITTSGTLAELYGNETANAMAYSVHTTPIWTMKMRGLNH